jgi:prepilin-type N-terminal cleavage/methylation domain-containing protein
MKQNGFTLIELLVVIAIIGLLSSLAVVSLSSARNKAYDAQIKSDLSQIRTWATLTYENGIYDGSDSNTAFDTANITPVLVPPKCSDSEATKYDFIMSVNAWSAWARECSDNTKYFCVDSTGIAKEITTLPTTDACPST